MPKEYRQPDKKSRVKINAKTEFEINNFSYHAVPIIEANTKGFVARLFSVSAVAALAITGAYGLYFNNYGPLRSTWDVAGPIIGWICHHFFAGRRKDTG